MQARDDLILNSPHSWAQLSVRISLTDNSQLLYSWQRDASLAGLCPFHARADQPVLHDSGIQECPDKFQQPLVFDALGNLRHQFVVLHSIEKFLQIEINDPTITLRDVLLRLGYSLMSRSTRSKTVTVLGERRVPSSLQNLHHRLLDESVQHGRNAELAHSSVRLRDFHPTDRLWFVGPTQQLL